MSLFPMSRGTFGGPAIPVEDSPDFEAEQASAKRKRVLAQTLRDRGMQTPKGQMVGRFFVAPSLAQGVSNVFDQVSAGMMDAQADKQERDTAQADQRMFKQWAAKFGPQKEKIEIMPETGAIDGSRVPAESIEMEVPQTREQILKLSLEGMRIPSARGLASQVAGKALTEDLERRKPLVVGDSVYEDGQFKTPEETIKRRKLELELKLRDLMERSADRAMDRDSRERIAREVNETRRELARLQGQGNALLNELRLGQLTEQQRRAEQAVRGRPLPPHTVTQITDVQTLPEKTDRYLRDYKDDYSGTGPLGRANVLIGEYSPVSTETQRQSALWWKDYQEHKNVVRNRLFGSALTRPEEIEWNKQDITPATHPDIVRQVLARRAEQERKAFKKIRDNLKRSGYDTSGFDDLNDLIGGRAKGGTAPGVPSGVAPTAPGRTAPPAPGAAAPAEDPPEIVAQTYVQAGDPNTRATAAAQLQAAGIAVINSAQEFMALKPGQKYVEKDGTIQVK